MKKYFIILFCLEVFVAIGALPVGWSFIKDPSGGGMGMSVDLLARSPLSDFLIPGLFLLLIHGTGNIIAALLSLAGKPVAGKAGMILGLILCLWIVIQVWWIGYSSFLQPMLFLTGLFQSALGWTIISKSQLNPGEKEH